MSLLDTESNVSDADEASDFEDRQLRLASGSLISPHQRTHAPSQSQSLAQAQIQVQAHAIQSERQLNLTNYGSVTFLYNPVQYISDLATGQQGHITMCKSFLATQFRRRWKNLHPRKNDAICSVDAESSTDSMTHELMTGKLLATSDGSRQKQQQIVNGSAHEQDRANSLDTLPRRPARESTPSAFISHPASWFKAGRYFSIWAPGDAEIHEGKFMLLDSQNIEGRGLRVKTLENEELRQIAESSSSFRTRVLLKGHGSHTPSSSSRLAVVADSLHSGQIKEQDPDLLRALDKKLLHVNMDEHAQIDVHPGTLIFLEVTYNIPFVKYKCVDHGMLGDEDLDDLRFHHIKNLVHSWRLTKQAKEYWGVKKQKS